jgi:hypothetical protein
MSDSNGQAQPLATNMLPLGFKSLTPLIAEHHQDLRFTPSSPIEFAREMHAVPLLVEEFSRVQLSFPIVFTKGQPYFPVAMLSAEADRNDYLDGTGAWRANTYIPAYLRRYPFALVKERAESQRMLLYADLSAPHFADASGGKPLFDDKEPSTTGKQIIEFCRRFETGMQSTRNLVSELTALDLFEGSSVKVQKGEKTTQIEGFMLVSEKRLQELEDAPLADLTRRGVTGLLAAHQFSISQFSEIMKGSF